MTNELSTRNEERELSPSHLVGMLSPQDKATIMSLCMPRGSTDSELALYLYRCKQLGFDPMSKELVLQKWVSNTGEVNISFITTRDALLKKAALNPDYTGINSGYVKEGDTFQVDTEKSIVHQAFGAKRGKLLAGWAIVYHKTRLPVIAVADYEEYAVANQKSPVWRAMPSAMIQKVAEVAALRRQFPILAQGVYTSEEMQTEDVPTPAQVSVVSEKKTVTPFSTRPKVKETPKETPEVVQEAVTAAEPEPELNFLEETPENKTPEPAQERTEQTVDQAPETPAAEPEAAPDIPENLLEDPDVYKCLTLISARTTSGQPATRIDVMKGEAKISLLALGDEGLCEVAKLHEGCFFKTLETYQDKGFTVVKKVEKIA